MQRGDENYAAWSDFKAFMDGRLAAVLRRETGVIHAADPAGLSGIEGAQIPGWGGYDYGLLAGAVDVMELYDFGANLEITRSLSPDTILLTTSFEGGPEETHRLWREFLKGARGTIIWDENGSYVAPDGAPGKRGQDAAPAYRVFKGAVGKSIMAGRRHYDPVAILYSQSSMRAQWMLDWRGRGSDWSRRSAASQYEENGWRGAMLGYLDALQHLGLEPRFVTPEMIEAGALRG